MLRDIDYILESFHDRPHVFNLGHAGHSCTDNPYAGCVLENRVDECNCAAWDPVGGASSDATNPPGGAPRALPSDPPILRVDNVGIAGSNVTKKKDGTNVAGQNISLIIRNMTHYEPFSFQWTYMNPLGLPQIQLNGPCTDKRDDEGKFTQATAGNNFNCNEARELEVEFCAVLNGTTYEEFLAGDTLILDQFPLTFYDLCALGPRRKAHACTSSAPSPLPPTQKPQPLPPHPTPRPQDHPHPLLRSPSPSAASKAAAFLAFLMHSAIGR